MKIERTVIGSFPLIAKPLDIAIKEVVDLQLKYGIDVTTDGEQRSDMITYFEQVPGLGRGSTGLRISGKIRPMDDSDDFFKIKDYKSVRSYLTSLNRQDVKTKITITGPVTLGVTSAIGGIQGYYSGLRDQRICSDCADALVPIAERALSIGALLQIDEPGISARYESPKFLEQLLSSLPDKAIDEGRVSLHVCGCIKQLYDELLSLSVNRYSFGFSGNKEKKNIEAISKESLEKGSKKLGVGMISNTVLEDAETALKRLIDIADIVGAENIQYVHPDCGFRSTKPPEIVEPILDNMKKASDLFIQSLSFTL